MQTIAGTPEQQTKPYTRHQQKMQTHSPTVGCSCICGRAYTQNYTGWMTQTKTSPPVQNPKRVFLSGKFNSYTSKPHTNNKHTVRPTTKGDATN